MNNEETIIGTERQSNYSAQAANPAQRQDASVENETSGGKDWQKIMIGGVAGVLLGAGAMFAVKANAAEPPEEQPLEAENDDAAAAEQQQQQVSAPHVATVSDSMSFSEAFASAREQVGPGGVFHWHGGIYGTYYATEWDAMSEAEHTAFAQSAQPEVHVHDVNTAAITAEHPDVVMTTTAPQPTSTSVEVVEAPTDHVAQIDIVDTPEPIHDAPATEGDTPDVHLLGVEEIDGVDVAVYDVTGNGDADIAIIDVDGSHGPSYPDIAVDLETGNHATIGEIIGGDEPATPDMGYTAMGPDEPSVDPMDYMNDAIVDV